MGQSGLPACHIGYDVALVLGFNLTVAHLLSFILSGLYSFNELLSWVVVSITHVRVMVV